MKITGWIFIWAAACIGGFLLGSGNNLCGAGISLLAIGCSILFGG